MISALRKKAFPQRLGRMTFVKYEPQQQPMDSNPLKRSCRWLLEEASALRSDQWLKLPQSFRREIVRLGDLFPGEFNEPLGSAPSNHPTLEQ